MAYGVFIHRADSIYDDHPETRYQFPPQYLGRAREMVGSWVLYYEPVHVRGARGYFAVARVQEIVPDPGASDRYLAIIEAGSYLQFTRPVSLRGPEGYREAGLLNEHGKLSGRAQSAVRPISLADFNRIIDLGLEGEDALPRVDEPVASGILREERSPFIFEQPRDRMAYFGSRLVRDRIFRQIILDAYDSRCAVTGHKFINGGGRAEAQAAHIRPVEHNGADDVRNGLALSGTAHWMFDRGLISLADDYEILISRQVNDRESVEAVINPTGKAKLPAARTNWPHPANLAWHREHVFKH